tara:strand:- start:185 stop:1303 length:1119 start_codon:yes stop_codon:yes gene_type:complete
MNKEYTSLGLMSGTSGDGVDASIVRSDGKSRYKVLLNKYFKYSDEIYKSIHSIKEKINNLKDLKNFSKELKNLERKITMFHVEVVSKISKSKEVDLVGFHGQTIYHNSEQKTSVQLGDGNLLSKLTNKNVVYNFRKNDIKNGGEGAPLTPIFHQLILKQNKINVPSCVLNIGGISNATVVVNYFPYDFTSRDIGPGNCLIDAWVRKNSNKKFDYDGKLASIGKINEVILEQAQELYSNRSNKKTLSLDVKDFDVSFARGLSLEDGAATLTDFTGRIIGAALFSLLSNVREKIFRVLICGGGRKNKTLLNTIKQRTLKNIVLQPIDDYGVDGDFVESQAFAYLAIRNLINEPISFPNTTGCSKPLTGGLLIKN